MPLISLTAFLMNIDAIAAESPCYKLGGDGTGGECDCIGLIIGAIRRSGGAWEGIHGSNYAARHEMAYLLPVTDADDLNVGEVVYKAAMPGQSNYALPSRYAKDPDQRDYYHVGVVRSLAPLQIVHCTSPGGVTTDTKLGKWMYRGWLNKVAQEGDETPVTDIKTATVAADTGSTVNLRKAPGGALVDRVPVGAAVTVTAQQDGWSRISYRGEDGWMMSQYLHMEGSSQAPAEGDVMLRLADAERRLDMAEQRLAALDGGFG